MSHDQVQLEVVTPRREILSTFAADVVFPALLGEMEIYPNHRPVLTALRPGRFAYVADGEKHEFYVAGGFAEVLSNRVVILADECESPDEIDLAQARENLDQARKNLDENRLLPADEREPFQRAFDQAQARFHFVEHSAKED